VALRRVEAIGAVGARLRALPAAIPAPTRPARVRTNYLPAVLVVVALGLTMAGVLADGAVQQTLLIVAAVAAAMIPVAGALARGRVDPFEIGVAVALAYLVLFPLRAAVVLLGWDDGAPRGTITASDPVVRDTLVAAALGLVAGGICYVAPLGARLGARLRIPSARAVERPSALLAAALFVFGAAAQSLILAASRNPSLPLIGGRGSGLVSSSSVLMLVGLCLLTRRAVLSRARADIAWVVAAMLAGAAVGVVGQFKEVVIVSLLAPLVMAHFTSSGGIRMRWLALAALVAVFLIFPVVTSWRQVSGLEGSENPVTVVSKLPSHYLHHNLLTGGERTLGVADVVSEPLAVVSRRLYGFDSLTLAVRYTPSQITYRRGATLEGLWAGAVPRILWPSKPNIGIGYWFAVHYWGTPAGVTQVPQTITHPGELYIDFGLAGVIIGMALLGLWYRFAYTALRPRETGTAALIYTILLLTVVSVDRDLPLVYVTLLQRLVVVTLLLLALTWFARLRQTRA
jgi:hypothetical protein